MEEGLFSLHTIAKDMLQGISISVEPSAQLTTCIPDQAQNLHSCTHKLRPSGKQSSWNSLAIQAGNVFLPDQLGFLGPTMGVEKSSRMHVKWADGGDLSAKLLEWERFQPNLFTCGEASRSMDDNWLLSGELFWIVADMALLTQYKVVRHESYDFWWSAVCLLSAVCLVSSKLSNTCRYDLTDAIQCC